ncbi:MAG: peptidylprolyl isomerase [Patescibacteria group bacterium]
MEETKQTVNMTAPGELKVAEAIAQKPRSEKESKNLRMFLIGIGGAVAVIVVGAAIFGAIRVYAMGGTDRATQVIATVLRLPLAKINGHVILYSSYLNDLKAIGTLRDYDKANDGTMANLTDTEMSDQVVWRLVNNIFIEDLAKKYEVTATQADVDDLKNQMLAQFESPEKAESELLQRYGWTLAEYEVKVIKPYVLQSKLSEVLENDTTPVDAASHEEVRVRAQKVLDEIIAGADFTEMAKKYGEDSTAANGGDLGWFGKGDMVAQFENAAFALKKGETTKELVETSFGYHIIHVDDTKTENVKGSDGKTTKEEKISARHIVFLFPDTTKSLDKSLETMLKESQVAWYAGKINNPIPAVIAAANASTTTK